MGFIDLGYCWILGLWFGVGGLNSLVVFGYFGSISLVIVYL